MTGNDRTESNSEAIDNDILLKLKDLYISDVPINSGELEHDTIERFKHLTVNDVEDIDEDLLESLRRVLHISGNEKTEKNVCVSNHEFEKYLVTVLLSKCEFPVTWNPIKPPPYDKPQSFMDKVADKDEEIEDTRQFKWDNFVLQLILAYELVNENRFSEAHTKVRELGSVLDTLQKENCKEPLYLTCFSTLHHVLASMEAYILVKLNLLLKAKNVLKNIVPVSKMTRIQHSAVLGLKAQVFMEYGFQSTKKGIEIIKEAIKLNEFQAEWYFILGSALGRIRRFNCYTHVDKEEISALEKALELDNNASYIVHLAQTYREHEHMIYLHSRDAKNTSVYTEKMFELITVSRKLIRKALELSPNCPHVNIRCALGLLKLPELYRRNLTRVIKKCIDIAIEKAPNNRMLHHVIGTYYTKVEDNPEKAEKHLEIAARQNTYGASIDLIKFRYRQNNEFDILTSLEAVLVQYTELERMCQTLAQIGSYYLFRKRDLVTATGYYLKIVDIYPQCETMKMHKVLFLRMSFPVNLYTVVSTEINLWLRNNGGNTSENKVLRRFIVKASVIDGNALKENEKHETSLVDEIIKESHKIDEIIATATKQKNLTRERIDKHLKEKQNKKDTSKHRKQTKKDKCEEDKSNENKTKRNKANKKFINKKSHINLKECKGLKRSHSVSSVDSDYHRDTSVPKFVWDICGKPNNVDGSNNNNHERPKNKGNPKKKLYRNDGNASHEVPQNKGSGTKSQEHYQRRRNSDSFIVRRNEHNYNWRCGENQGTSNTMVRSVSTERESYGPSSGNFFNKNNDRRNFGTASSWQEGESYRKRLDSSSSMERPTSGNFF